MVAADGSNIPPERHSPARFFVLNNAAGGNLLSDSIGTVEDAAAKVDDAAVRDARAGGKPSHLVGLVQVAMGLGAIVLLLVFAWLGRRKRHA